MAAKGKYVDAFEAALEAYAREGLEQAKAAGAKKFRVDWADAPFLTRVYNLSRYWSTDAEVEYEDQLRVPRFPKAELRALRKELGKPAAELFVNEDGDVITTEDGHDAAFDCGPYIEAGEWVQMLIDATILRLEAQMAKANPKMKIEFCGHDGQYPFEPKHYLGNIKEIREEREYDLTPSAVEALFAVFTDRVPPEVSAALAKLKPRSPRAR